MMFPRLVFSSVAFFLIVYPAVDVDAVTFTTTWVSAAVTPDDPDNWYFRRTTWDDSAPFPSNSGHSSVWGLENSDGYNVPYHVNTRLVETSGGTPNALETNVITDQTDFNSDQKEAWNSAVVNGLEEYQTAQPSIKYNCHAYGLGLTNKWLSSSKYFTQPLYFPSSGNPDWEDPAPGPVRPDYIGYESEGVLINAFYAKHTSQYETVPETFVIDCETVEIDMPRHHGKWGLRGRYKSPPSYPEDELAYGPLSKGWVDK